MNPTRIHLRNYRTFVDLDLELPVGPVAIVGDNGAGKSTIMGAIEVALFGPPPPARTMAPYLAEQGTDELVSVDLTFEHDNELYRVTRSYTAAGKGKSTLDFARNHLRDETDETSGRDDAWLTETRETAAATQTRIEQVIGLTRDTFRASAFLAQGDGAAFTEAQPKDRKRILADVMGLDLWERAREQIAIDRRTQDSLVTQATATVMTLEERAGDRDAVVSTAAMLDTTIADDEVYLAAAERLHVEAGALVQAHAAAATQRQAHQTAVNAARNRATEHAALAQQGAEAAERITQIDAELAALGSGDDLEAADAARTRLQDEREALAARIHAYDVSASEKAAQLDRRMSLTERFVAATEDAERVAEQARKLEAADEADAPHCDRCDQVLGADAKARAIQSYYDEAAAKKADAEKLTAEADAVVIPEVGDKPDAGRLATIDKDLAAASIHISSIRGRLEQRARLEERRTHAQAEVDSYTSIEFVDELARLRAEAEAAEAALAALPDLEGQADAIVDAERLSRDVERLNQTLRANRDLASRARGRLEEINEALAARDEAIRIRDDARKDAGELERLEKACGRDGIPAWLVEQKAIPQIEAGASRLLEQMGGPVTRVELRTERALQDGGVADALDIVCVTENGDREYSTFSGGEKTRVNLALRISLARLLAHRRGAESRVLAIDEPEFLDAAGTERLVQILRDDVAPDFSRVMLVSHVPALRDAFDTVIAVRNTDGLSEVEVV